MRATRNQITAAQTARILLCCLAAQTAVATEPSLTIYNQNFAVVRDTVTLDLKTGVNRVQFDGATAHLEPSSVVLRDPAGKHQLQVLEQNYRGDPVSQEMLLTLNEGKTIEFEVVNSENGQVKRDLIKGKVIRSGSPDIGTQYNPYYYGGYGNQAPLQPIIEVNGKLQFRLPGQPIFPSLADNTILKPTLAWVIQTGETARFEAEVSYVTGEMRWESDYNLVLPERGDTLDLVGWITMDNESGTSFQQARIKLMAGDVSKIQGKERGYGYGGIGNMGGGGAPPPTVTEKSFDEYHLYTLERPATLLDKEKKQVEFARAADVHSTRIYIYDGAAADPDQNWGAESVHREAEYGTKCNQRIWAFREVANSTTNHLGMPLPKGRVRVYRRNTDGQMEFTGENTIKHTPRDEVIRLFTGNVFDLVGERKQTDFKINVPSGGTMDSTTGQFIPGTNTDYTPWIDESFEITLRNHKTEAAEVRVVEHLYRGANWEITKKSDSYVKTDVQTIEFRLPLKPDEERKLTYTAHYWW